MKKTKPGITSIFLGFIFLMTALPVSAQENAFYTPKKGMKSIFINVEGERAYIFEIYRLPEGGGFTGRKVIDTLTKDSNGNYEGKASKLKLDNAPYMLKLKNDGHESEVNTEIIKKEDHHPFDGALNNALLNQFAVELEKEIEQKYPAADFSAVDVINRFYDQQKVYWPFKEYESKYKVRFAAYADSINKKLFSYNETAMDLRKEIVSVGPEKFKAGMDNFPGEGELKVSYFKDITNELAQSNPSTYFTVAEMSSEEMREKMFRALTGESRRNLIHNGPNCDMKDAVKKQHRKKVLVDIGLIGVPSALIIVGAATVNTE
jgi:hypothetical protein